MPETRSSTIKLTDMKTLVVQPNNGKSLYIDTSSVAFINVKKNSEEYITSIRFEDKESISLGDRIIVNIGNVDSVYEVKFIALQDTNNSVLLFSSIPTKTTTFILPILNKTKLQLKYDTYFVNAFLSRDEKYIILQYRFTGTPMYTEFEHTLMSDPLFVAHKDYDNYHVAYIFRIEEKFWEDIANFMKGKYSLFSKTLRQRIQKFYGNTDLASTIKIIDRDEELRKQIEKHLDYELPKDSELASVPEKEEEIYNIK